MRVSRSELERQRYLEQQRIDQDAASLAGDLRAARNELKATTEELKAATEQMKAAKEQLKDRASLDRQAAYGEGQEKGKVLGRIQLLQQLLKQLETPSAELERLSAEGLLALEDSLKRKLTGQQEANGTAPADKPSPG